MKFVDRDGDGLADNWERARFGDLSHGAEEDADLDGLNLLEEYAHATDPANADSDGDGLADGWEHHWFGHLEQRGGSDHDDDLVTDRAELERGTNPTHWDTDQDGLPDAIELYGTLTDPRRWNVMTTVNEVVKQGVDVSDTLGVWVPHHGSIYGARRRGYVEYVVDLPRADVYRLEIEGRSHEPADRVGQNSFDLRLYIDGEVVQLKRKTLRTTGDSPGVLHGFTPWLPRGRHTLRIFWDNAAAPTLRIDQVRLQSIVGPDLDENGI